MQKIKNIIWKFDKKENFGFLIPEDRKEYNCDFFVALRNSNNAKNWDFVEAVEIKNSKWKSREAKIVKILKNNDLIKNNQKNVLSNESNVIWIFSQWKWDFWFIDIEWKEKWYFVFSNNKNNALDWDKVEAKIKTFNWKEEAEVVRVIERKQELIVWEYVPWKWNNFWFVIPNNPQIKNDIFVPWKKSMEAKSWDIVWVHVINWVWKNPEWEVKEIIWKKWDKKIDVLSIIVEWWARINFSDEVLSFADKKSQKEIYWEGIKGRQDLTNLFTFTIDWEDAKDLDDAISIEKLENEWYKLYVHIADVSEYVTEKSPLDIEAYKRATSIYLVDRVIPMLPEKLSNDLCSLNPNTRKLTLTCEMIIWNNWKIKSQKVYESIISTNYRLTYKEVDEILKNNSFLNNQKQPHPNPLLIGEGIDGIKFTEELVETLKISNELKEKITKYKNSIWVLNFDFPETKILLDDEWNPISIKEYPRYDSNKLIEEFMVSANEAVSKEFSDLPFLYRIHEEPKEDDLVNLQNTLNLFWVKFIFEKWTTSEFSKLLNIINSKYDIDKNTNKWNNLDEWSKVFLEKAILRTLSKAVYSKENLGHFWLWLSFYSHFTSPIRRYPDLQIHRIIKEKIHKKLDKKRVIHYNSILDDVSKHTSDKERKAEKIEYKVKDYFIVKYYKDKIWEQFEWIINWVIPKWFFVSLKDTAEWFVELQRTDFLDSLKQHTDLFTWKRYRLWDKVLVKLIEADEKLLRLNFEVL